MEFKLYKFDEDFDTTKVNDSIRDHCNRYTDFKMRKISLFALLSFEIVMNVSEPSAAPRHAISSEVLIPALLTEELIFTSGSCSSVTISTPENSFSRKLLMPFIFAPQPPI